MLLVVYGRPTIGLTSCSPYVCPNSYPARAYSEIIVTVDEGYKIFSQKYPGILIISLMFFCYLVSLFSFLSVLFSLCSLFSLFSCSLVIIGLYPSHIFSLYIYIYLSIYHSLPLSCSPRLPFIIIKSISL